MKEITILGSTGSIGIQALDVIRNNNDKFKVIGLSANKNINKLIEQIAEFKPKYVAIADCNAQKPFNKIKPNFISVLSVDELALIKVDIVLNAMVGLSGLIPSINVLKNGVNLAMANKETVVTAGKFLNETAKANNSHIIPVDSEHNAIWQCLSAGNKSEIKRLILTASGGPFKDFSEKQLQQVTPMMATNHPVWKMGKKVTVDSSTLMNKGLEVIEAMHLFNVPINNIDVVVHRESVIHSMVEFVDNTVMACLSNPDMRLPIQLSLTYPNRFECPVRQLNFYELGALHFEKPNADKFRCLHLAYEAVKIGEGSVVALSTADEVIVEKFLDNQIKFTDIPKYLEKAINFVNIPNINSIQEVIEIDTEVRKYVNSILNKAGN